MTESIKVFGDRGLGTISGVVATLPAGYTLGEERLENGINYRLMYNAGNSQINPGFIGSPKAGALGPYSCTISTVSDGNNALGAVVVVHATATTATFFWGAYRGYPVKLAAQTASLITGSSLMVGVDGTVKTAISGGTDFTFGANRVIGYNIGAAANKTITTNTASGDCAVHFQPVA